MDAFGIGSQRQLHAEGQTSKYSDRQETPMPAGQQLTRDNASNKKPAKTCQ
jgi:hypothetical protein